MERRQCETVKDFVCFGKECWPFPVGHLEPLEAFKKERDEILSNLCFRKIAREMMGRMDGRWGRRLESGR